MSIAAFMGGGVAGGGSSSTYADDNFKVVHYAGTGSTRTVETGLTGLNAGCMIMIFTRSTISNSLFDTNIGAGNLLVPGATSATVAEAGTITAFTSSGFTVGNSGRTNASGTQYFAYVFKKAPTLMDMVTFTGTGSTVTVNHALGAAPGMILVKRTSGTQNWFVWHKDAGTNKILYLNADTAGTTSSAGFTSVTSTSFSLGSFIDSTAGASYVAYIFPASNASLVCGSYTGNGQTSGPSVSLGWEPGFTLCKSSTYAGGGAYWAIQDKQSTMKGAISSTNSNNNIMLMPNSGEFASPGHGTTSSGFTVQSNQPFLNDSGATYIYMAIRNTDKPASQLPTTSFFNTVRNAEISNTAPRSELYPNIGFNPDILLGKHTTSYTPAYIYNRDDGNGSNLAHYKNIAETGTIVNDTAGVFFNRHHAVTYGGAVSANTIQGYFFKKTIGFFEMAAWTGNGSTQTISHKLGAVPELIIVRPVDTAADWPVYSATTGDTMRLYLDSSLGKQSATSSWNATPPTSTNFYVGDISPPGATNATGVKYYAYLFASVPGKVKIGSYVGTGVGNQNVNCGFTTGARFVMVKNVDVTSNWCVFDTVQGINSGADGYIRLQAALPMNLVSEGTDIIDPLSTGFSATDLTDGLNEDTATYIYMAIA